MADFRSGSAVDFANRTNTTIPAPAGIQNDDGLLIIHVVGASGTPPTATPPAGFVALPGFPVLYSDGTPGTDFTYRVNVWQKVADGESGDYEVIHAAGLSTAYMLAGLDIDIADPIEPNPTIATGAGDPTTVPGITTPRNESLVVLWCADWELFGGGTAVPGGTTPTFTERYDGASTLYVATGVMGTAGATGDKTLDLPAGGGAGVARGMIVLQDAGGVIRDLAGVATGRSLAQGALSVARGLSGQVAGRAQTIGAISVLRNLVGVVAGRSTAQGAFNALRRLAGIAQGVGRAIGSLFLASELLNPLAIDDRTIHSATWEDDRTIEDATWEDFKAIDLPLITMTAKDRLNPIAKGDARTVRRTYRKLPTGALLSKAWLTIKKRETDPDAQALIQKDITIALTVKGQITDADTAGGEVGMFFEITKEDTAQAQIKVDVDYPFDIQILRATGQPHTLSKGTVKFFLGVTDANS